jgi:hypothetical protein
MRTSVASGTVAKGIPGRPPPSTATCRCGDGSPAHAQRAPGRTPAAAGSPPTSPSPRTRPRVPATTSLSARVCGRVRQQWPTVAAPRTLPAAAPQPCRPARRGRSRSAPPTAGRTPQVSPYRPTLTPSSEDAATVPTGARGGTRPADPCPHTALTTSPAPAGGTPCPPACGACDRSPSSGSRTAPWSGSSAGASPNLHPVVLSKRREWPPSPSASPPCSYSSCLSVSREGRSAHPGGCSTTTRGFCSRPGPIPAAPGPARGGRRRLINHSDLICLVFPPGPPDSPEAHHRVATVIKGPGYGASADYPSAAPGASGFGAGCVRVASELLLA